jgi:hypothetical protein
MSLISESVLNWVDMWECLNIRLIQCEDVNKKLF